MEITRIMPDGSEVCITLTTDELEVAYRERQRQYLLENARRHIKEYCDYEGLADLSDDDGLAEVCMQRFEDDFNCNVDENAQWESAVRENIRGQQMTL